MIKHLRSVIERVNQNAGKLAFVWEFIGLNVIFGYIWILGGYEKIAPGVFAPGLGKTLGYFASKNPYGWYVDYLNSIAIPNSVLLGTVIQWGELLAGLMLLIGVIVYFLNTNSKVRCWIRAGMIAALAGLCLMSANFYFAAGWTGPSTHTVNVLMFWVELVMLFSWIMIKTKN